MLSVRIPSLEHESNNRIDNLLLEDLKIKQDVLENLEYLALCHYPEVVYLMLQHYGSN